MKKESLVKFDDMDMEVLSSDKELSSVNGGLIPIAGTIAETLIETILGIDINNNCHNCNDNCGCATNNKK